MEETITASTKPFEIRLASPDYLSSLMEIIATVSEVGTFRVSREGIRLIELNIDHTVLVDFRISGYYFVGRPLSFI